MEQSDIFKAEIHELEAKLEAKKRAMTRAGAESQPERDVFRQVVREHVGTPMPSGAPSQKIPVTPQGTYVTISQPLSPELEKRLEKIIQDAFTSGLAKAIKEARKTNDPSFIDLVHDYLADEYYQKLVRAKRLEEH